MGDDALTYRINKNLQKLDEQMGLLVMRVSGSYHENYFLSGHGRRRPFATTTISGTAPWTRRRACCGT